MVRSRSILASNGNFVRTPLRASRDVTGKAFVIAVLAILTLAMPGPAADAGSGPVGQKLILQGPVLVKGQNAAKPLPPWLLEPPPSHPLSNRAQAIKNGLLTPATPGAKAILAEPPLPEAITSGRVIVHEVDANAPRPHGLTAPAPSHPVSERAIPIKSGLARPMEPEAVPVLLAPPPRAAGLSLPSVGNSFEGIDEFDQGFGNFPPDGGLGVGPLYLVEVTNSHIAYFTKDGAKTFEADPSSFFGSSSQLVDPFITYDPLSGRFFFAEFNRDNVVFVAASVSSDPNDGWCTYSTNSGIPAGVGIDFTQMGVSDTTETVSFNMDNGQNLVYFFNKANMINCASNADGVFFTDLTHCDGTTNVFALRPARMHTSNDTEYLVGTDSTNDVTVWRAFDPVGTSRALSRACVNTGTYSAPPNAPQPNNPPGGLPLETGDERALQVVERNGHLFVWHNGSGGSCSDTGSGLCSELFFKEIDVSSFPTLTLDTDTYLNGGADYHYFYPAIDVDSGNQIGFGTTFVSSVNSRYAGAAFGSRDGAGNYSFYGLLAEGQSNQQNIFPAGRNRWGDYFWGNEDVCPSPLGYWEEIEYAGPGDVNAQNGTWNTIIGNLFSSSPPSNDSCAGGPTLAFPTVGLSQDATFATYSQLDPLDPLRGR